MIFHAARFLLSSLRGDGAVDGLGLSLEKVEYSGGKDNTKARSSSAGVLERGELFRASQSAGFFSAVAEDTGLTLLSSSLSKTLLLRNSKR